MVPPVEYVLTREMVSDYQSAVGDGTALYQQEGAVPPTALATLAVGTLLDFLHIPPGAIHGSQELEFSGPVRVGQRVACSGRVAQNQVRGKARFLTVECSVVGEDGAVVMRGRSLIVAPVEA
jgi:acyl dehydratase